jgi:hypothetical protein
MVFFPILGPHFPVWSGEQPRHLALLHSCVYKWNDQPIELQVIRQRKQSHAVQGKLFMFFICKASQELKLKLNIYNK